MAQARRAGAPIVVLRPGLVITRSVRVRPGTYRLAAPASLDSALITIRGDDVTVDFAGASLEGQPPDADPDLARGVAIRVEGGRHVRILHARIRGYRVGILARGTRGLDLVDDDVSYTWKPRLFSLIEHESLVDWQSYHHNEHDEWLRWGAAFYLADVRGGEVRGSRAVQGANGLMLVRSDSLEIDDNDFSFNSGTGIALYRSSWNRIVHNRVDFDMRGYSHKFYRRGQDSAGLLMYEQSSNNVVAYNSITHGGDGVFLWAGQSTMDSGSGGANDNLFFGNDVSFAAANGIEATFARNAFIANRSNGSEYGVWGGYSYGSTIAGNDLSGNRIGVAIEHGQDDTIAYNRFADETTGISLWADSVTDTSWGYPKHRDVRSRNYSITNNLFRRLRVGLRARQTDSLTEAWNRWWNVDSSEVVRDAHWSQSSEEDVRAGGDIRQRRAAPARRVRQPGAGGPAGRLGGAGLSAHGARPLGHHRGRVGTVRLALAQALARGQRARGAAPPRGARARGAVAGRGPAWCSGALADLGPSRRHAGRHAGGRRRRLGRAARVPGRGHRFAARHPARAPACRTASATGGSSRRPTGRCGSSPGPTARTRAAGPRRSPPCSAAHRS